MKKVKVTRKPGTNKDYTLRPVRWRMALIYAFFFTIAVLIGMSIRLIFNSRNEPLSEMFSDWYINLAIVVGGAVIFALVDYARWTIRVIGGEKVEGPSGALGDRFSMPIHEIDWPRSAKSLNSRLKVGNAIYSAKRGRILISPWFYNSSAFRELLTRIGYTPETR